MATGTRRKRADDTPKPEPTEGDNPEPSEENPNGPEGEGEGDDHTGDESGAMVDPSALLASAREAEANSDRLPPRATWGQMNFLLHLVLRVILGFSEEESVEARSRQGASGLISTLKAQGVEQGIIHEGNSNGNNRR